MTGIQHKVKEKRILRKRSGFSVILIMTGCFVLSSLTGITEAASVCVFQQKEDSIVLTNNMCRILWSKTAEGWQAEFQLKQNERWHSLAYDVLGSNPPYEILLEDFEKAKDFSEEFSIAGQWQGGRIPIKVIKAFPPSQVNPRIIESSEKQIQIEWSFPAQGELGKDWKIQTTYSIRAGDYHIHEKVRFVRLGNGPMVRLRRGWHVKNIPNEFLSSTIRSITQMGFRFHEGTFVALATHDKGIPWTPFSGGGGFVGDKYDLDMLGQSIYHQVPPCIESAGWVELHKGETYTLEHYIILHPAYLFSDTFLNYMYKLQPLEYLPPRYSIRHFIDKCLWTLRYTPDVYVDGGQWGLYYKNWYALNKGGRVEKVSSLDWGSSWDIWNAYFLLLYAEQYNDDWARQRYQKLRNGIVMLDWQIDEPGLVTDGAFWMERDEHGMFHISDWMSKTHPKSVWVCDAAKVGYFLCLLYERTQEKILLEKAVRASEFLLRIQKESGDLIGSVLNERGEVITPSNFAGTVSTVMLWAKLYEITGDSKYLCAAEKSADYSVNTWLSDNQWQIYGGEIDKPNLPCATAAMYAAMSFSELAMVTEKEKYVQAAAKVANYLLCQQWLFDIHYGYYRNKARWHGTDFKTAGSLQGWIRPECTFSLYLAWKATGDRRYRYGMEQHANWMTYMQYDDSNQPRTFGGGSEYFQYMVDNLNGFGSNFFPETVGQAVALILMEQEVSNEK